MRATSPARLDRALGVLALAALLLLAGCGGGQRGAPSGSTSGAAPAPGAEAAPSAASTAASPAGAPAPAYDVTIGSAAATLNVVAVDVAVEHGFFAQEGVLVQHTIMKSDATIAGLVSGEVHFTGATGSLARAIPMGLPASVVLFMVKAPNSSMYAHRDVRRVEDLAGQPFGVNSLVSDVRVIADHVFRGHGVDPQQVGYVAVGEDRIPALLGAQIKGTMLSPPVDLLAEREGFVRLARASDHIQIPMAGLGASRSALQQDREMVRRTLRAMLRTIAFLQDDREQAVQFIARKFEMTREEAERAYDSMVWSRNGEVSSEGLKVSIDYVQETANVGREIRPDEIVDYSVLREVQRELGL
jgi:ABC-type nitrate/sulfonate/bicarbonate transport system substrate-binding protein